MVCRSMPCGGRRPMTPARGDMDRAAWPPRLPRRAWNCSSSPRRQFPSRCPAGPGGARSSRPKLGDLPVERTVWTIAAPHTFQPARGKRGQIQFLRSTVGFQGAAAEKMDLTPFPLASANVAAGDIAAQWQRFVAEGQASVSSAAPGPNDVVALEYRPIEPRVLAPAAGGHRRLPGHRRAGRAGRPPGPAEELGRPLACCLRRRLRAGMVAVVVAQRGGFAYRAGRVVVPIPAAETTWEAGSGCRLNAR